MLSDKIGRPIQESLLALLVWDDAYGGIVAKLLTPELFDGDYEEIARRVGRYWAAYNRAPKRQVDELFVDIFKDETARGDTYANLFTYMLELHQEGLNAEFLLDAIHRFSRAQELKRLTVNIIEQVQARGEEALEDVDRQLDAYRTKRVEGTSTSLTLFEVEPILNSLQSVGKEFDFGIEDLDRGYVTPVRGELLAVLGVTGTGKSWSLVHLSKRAMMRRRKVLYVTCEMSSTLVGARFYQSILGIPKRSTESLITRFLYDDGKFAGFTREAVKADFALLGDYSKLELTTRIRRMEAMFSRLRIRGFADGELTPAKLEAVLDEDAAVHKFVPDMVVVDYLGAMQVSKEDIRVSLGQTAKGLRAIAQRRNVAMITAQQISREGKNVQATGKDVDIQHAAEDWSLIGTCDIALTLSQTKLESELGLIRLLAAKVRNEPAHYTVVCTQDYPRGQFALQSQRIPSSYSKLVEAFTKDQKDKARAQDDETSDDE